MTLVPPVLAPGSVVGFVPGGGLPFSNITPFTYRDGLTYLEVLEHLRGYIRDTLVPFINEQLASDVTEWNAEMVALVSAVDAALATQAATVNTDLSTQATAVNTAIANFTTLMNAAIATLTSSSITVTDPIIDGVLTNIASASRVLLDSLYGKKSDVTTLQANVVTINGEITTLNSEVAALTAVPAWYAPNHGIIGNGSDESVAVNAFLAGAAAAGAVALFQKGTTVCVGASITPVSGNRINLNGATFQMLGSAALGVRTVMITGVTDVQIWGGAVDGNKAAFAAVTEQRHAMMIENSSNITVRDMYLYNAKGDGLYVGDDTAGISSNIFVDNIWCDQNWRNGMSISHVNTMTVTNSQFTNTNGTAPMAGCDVEPNVGTVACTNIVFSGCTFSGNAHMGLIVQGFNGTQSSLQGDISIIGCTITGNGVANDGLGGGLQILNITTVSMIGGQITSNTGNGIQVDHTFTTQDVHLSDISILANTHNGIAVTAPVTYFVVMGCEIRGNGTSATNTLAGISLMPTATSGFIRIIGCVSTASSQKYGIETNSFISRLILMGNDFEFNGTAAYSLADVIGSRTLWDTGVGSKYVSDVPVFNASFGVGNAVAFGTLGAGAKKFQIFDNAGASLGFVPVYVS